MKFYRVLIVIGLALMLAGGIGVAATLTNDGGAIADIISTEADTGGAQNNAAGGQLEYATPDQLSVDAATPNALLFLGLIDPVLPKSSAAKTMWALYE